MKLTTLLVLYIIGLLGSMLGASVCSVLVWKAHTMIFAPDKPLELFDNAIAGALIGAIYCLAAILMLSLSPTLRQTASGAADWLARLTVDIVLLMDLCYLFGARDEIHNGAAREVFGQASLMLVIALAAAFVQYNLVRLALPRLFKGITVS